MSWRIAKSLEALRSQVNAAAPNRSKASDGTVGDAAHASRSSDHNPWVKDGTTGVVTALDITHDPARGVDAGALAESLLASRDPRIKYIISNRRIASGAAGPSPWVWRPYSGTNPHTLHVHVSVRPEKAHYDSTAAWKFDLGKVGSDSPKPSQPTPTLRKGAKGADVGRLQTALNAAGASPRLVVDNDFGPKTDTAVRAFQRTRRLVVDGIVGPYTWAALGAA